MLATRLVSLGISPEIARGIIVLVFGLIGGILAAGWPTSPFLPAAAAFLSGLAALVNPNARPLPISAP